MVQHDNGQSDGEPERDEPGRAAGDGAGSTARMVRLVVGAHLLTVNPVDGSEIQPCPPGELPGEPRKVAPDERPAQGSSATPAGGTPAGAYAIPVLERDEEREQLTRQLARGRSIRLTGPSGSGRSTLLDAVAEDVAGLAPDGVVRLSGYRRTISDLLQELFAAVFEAPRGVGAPTGSGGGPEGALRQRPGGEELRAALAGVGAVVILDDLAFGGATLDELLDATPECAFLLAATPDVAVPSADSGVEEVLLSGLSRTGSLELLEHAVRRPLTNEETDWAGDLWFDSEGSSEGLPLRLVQAGALLRHAGAPEPGGGTDHGTGHGAGHGGGHDMAALIAGRLSPAAGETLRLALALGGELPHHTQLPALVGDPQAGDAVAELAAAGLVTAAGAHYRLAAGVGEDLNRAGYADGADDRALTAAQHYGWWTGHPSVTPERVGAEADVLLAAIHGAQRGGHASAAVLLARTAAPILASAQRWSAWERVLRGGLEASHISGEVAEKAYFHHELGVLALCNGQLERADTELEASIGLRGVLADQRGAVAGRRAQALVTDLLAAERAAAATPEAAVQGVHEERPAPLLPSRERIDSLKDRVDAARTVAATAAQRTGAEHTETRPIRRGRTMSGTRRNLVAAGAGAVLVAVLGTIVTLGGTSDDGGSSGRGHPGQSSTHQDDSDLTADDPTTGDGSPDSGATTSSGDPAATSESPGATDSATKSSPSESSSKPDHKPSGSGSGPGHSGGSGGGSSSSSPPPSSSRPPSSPPPSGGSNGGSDGGTDGGGSDGGSTDGGSTDGGANGGGTNGGTDDGGSTDGGSASGSTTSSGAADGGSGTPTSPPPSPTA